MTTKGFIENMFNLHGFQTLDDKAVLCIFHTQKKHIDNFPFIPFTLKPTLKQQKQDVNIA